MRPPHLEAKVTVDIVQSLRDGGERSTTLIWAARAGLAAAVVAAIALIYLLIRSRGAAILKKTV